MQNPAPGGEQTSLPGTSVSSIDEMNERQRSILTSAQVLFGRHGYSATTVKAIAEEAGVGFGLVSHYFGSKEKLFLSAGFAKASEVKAKLKENTADAECGLEAVRRFICTYLSFTTKEQRATFAILVRCSPFSDIETDLDRRAIATKFLELVHILRDCIQDGVDDGSIRELPAEETAFIIFANLVGAVRTAMLTPYDVPDLFDATVAFVVRSIAQRECVHTPAPCKP